MPFRAGYPSADLHSALVKPREGLTDMVLSPERRRSGAVCLCLLASELPESDFLYAITIRNFPKRLYKVYNLIGDTR